MSGTRIYLIPLWLRLWHWSNAALFLTLIVTGASLHFAAPGAPLIPFATARQVHNVAGIALAVLYAALLVANVVSGNWREFVPRPRGFLGRLMVQQRYYAKDIFTGAPHPFAVAPGAKFNPLQQITYLGVIYGALPLLILSGLAYLFPELAPDRLFGLGGVWPVAVVHYLLALFLSVFLIGHVYMATAGASVFADIKMMITGWHEGHATHKENRHD